MQEKESLMNRKSDGQKRTRHYLVAAFLWAWLAAPPLPAFGAAEPVLDLNKATVTQLSALPGIGSVRARAIVARRSELPFGRVEELLDVPGIGDSVFTGLRDRVRVEPVGPVPDE